MSRKLWTMSALSLLYLGACSSNPPSDTDAGPSGTGGAAAGTGGTTGGGTGGTTGGTGGSNGAGGAPGTGGGNGAGGSSAGVGGARGTGGSPVDAGPPADGGATSPLMNFFVTSRGLGNGGNLGGLAGADAFCKMLANAVSPALGAQTWHAYLSTTTVNARDRIGTGPWRNAAGHIIANNLTDLHDQIPANAALNATWPINDLTIALDERGNQVPLTPLVHDILTGSNTDGTLLANATCNNWTSSATTDIAQIGHTNRSGGGRPPSWNSAHATTGCAQYSGVGSAAMTVASGGGRGSIYCFAVP